MSNRDRFPRLRECTICGARWSGPVCSECFERARTRTDPADLDAIARALRRAWAALERNADMPAGNTVSIPVRPETRDWLRRRSGELTAKLNRRATFDDVITELRRDSENLAFLVRKAEGGANHA